MSCHKQNKTSTLRVRGTRDFVGDEWKLYKSITDIACTIGLRYGYSEIETPILEYADVFQKTLGNESDIVTKELYTFNDRDKRQLTMRPEFTASVTRAFISGAMAQQLPQKLFSTGPVFRHERPQKGRYRQIYQLNYEFFGAKTYASDIEMISMAMVLVNNLHLSNICAVKINTLGDDDIRTSYRNALKEYFQKYETSLSDISKIRLQKNVLRILDSKELEDKDIILNSPSIINFLNKKSMIYWEAVLRGLTDLGINYIIDDKLVRGLDYYTSIVFEVVPKNNSVSNILEPTLHDVNTATNMTSTIIAGGRYDNLVAEMGGDNIQSIGFAGGIDRIAMLLYEQNLASQMLINANGNIIKIYIIPIGDRAKSDAIKLSHILRNNDVVIGKNITIYIEYDKSVKKMMKEANAINATLCIIIGDDEIDKQLYRVKNMINGNEVLVNLSELYRNIQNL